MQNPTLVNGELPPRVFIATQERDEAFSWHLLSLLSGINPQELLGENAHRAANGLLGDANEHALFNMLAWYLEPEVSKRPLFKDFRAGYTEDRETNFISSISIFYVGRCFPFCFSF